MTVIFLVVGLILGFALGQYYCFQKDDKEPHYKCRILKENAYRYIIEIYDKSIEMWKYIEMFDNETDALKAVKNIEEYGRSGDLIYQTEENN